jgi:hypothetical protein
VAVLLIVSNARSGKVVRHRLASRDEASLEADAVLRGWYARTRGRRRGAGEGLQWSPGLKGRRHPYKLEVVEVPNTTGDTDE